MSNKKYQQIHSDTAKTIKALHSLLKENVTAEEVLKWISKSVEEAYIQGAKDAKGIYTSEGKPAYAEGFDFQEMQLPTIASLYAKEQGFKP
ncbi:MAG: hypothetical protein EO766_13195 [Hydrotalea sp. AMD]|uniref:hypothetical protein n=1 Tax=Hydrotalea sp. AMD TaxID=2501297 RepID=UPI001025DD2D|nr:hypothetical protein [Hydrotalea sp. AMD]RWZ86756.1 MAG: hypothetical protein EO766_13195 [Hydrotalea sp. AMD]